MLPPKLKLGISRLDKVLTRDSRVDPSAKSCSPRSDNLNEESFAGLDEERLESRGKEILVLVMKLGAFKDLGLFKSDLRLSVLVSLSDEDNLLCSQNSSTDEAGRFSGSYTSSKAINGDLDPSKSGVFLSRCSSIFLLRCD